MAANSSVLFAAAPPPPPLTLDDQLAQLTLIGGTSNALIHQSFRILSLVAQQHASDVRGWLARTSSPKNKQNLLDTFRVLLSKSANTASLALAFGFWSFEETLSARKMQLVLSLKAAGKWPLPALPAAATERSGRLVVLGLRWQQAGFAKHYHALLPLNIGLGIRVRSHAVQLAHEASLASASGSMVGVAKASLMLYQQYLQKIRWQAWSTFYLNHVIRLQWAIEGALGEKAPPDQRPFSSGRVAPPAGMVAGWVLPWPAAATAAKAKPAAASGAGVPAGAAGAYDVGVAVQAAVSTELLRAEKLGAAAAAAWGAAMAELRGGGGAAAADGGGAAEGVAGPEEEEEYGSGAEASGGVWESPPSSHTNPGWALLGCKGKEGEEGKGCDGAEEAKAEDEEEGAAGEAEEEEEEGGGGDEDEEEEGGWYVGDAADDASSAAASDGESLMADEEEAKAEAAADLERRRRDEEGEMDNEAGDDDSGGGGGGGGGPDFLWEAESAEEEARRGAEELATARAVQSAAATIHQAMRMEVGRRGRYAVVATKRYHEGGGDGKRAVAGQALAFAGAWANGCLAWGYMTLTDGAAVMLTQLDVALARANALPRKLLPRPEIKPFMANASLTASLYRRAAMSAQLSASQLLRLGVAARVAAAHIDYTARSAMAGVLAQDPSMSYEALTLMQGVERSKRWGVGFYSFYHNTLVNSQLKLEKAYPKEAPDYLKPATRSPNPHAVPAGLVGDGYLLPSAAALSDARRPIPPLFAAAISAQLAPSADWSSYLLAASAAAMAAPAAATTKAASAAADDHAAGPLEREDGDEIS